MAAPSGFHRSPVFSTSFTYRQLENQGMGSHPKIHPTGLVSDFQADEKSSIDKIAPKGRNTCLILVFSSFPESPDLSASFIYGWLANPGMRSHSKIYPTGLVGNFQAAAILPQRRSS